MTVKWQLLAEGQVGTREIRGSANNPVILGYRKDARCSWMKGSEEAVPWCAIFVNAMLERAGVKGTASPAAKSFTTSTLFKRLAGPAAGAICVIERNPPHPSLGHVGFAVAADAFHVWLVGGNQADAVNVSRFPLSRVVGFYWPAGQTSPLIGNFGGQLAAVDGGKVV
ncbi:MAG TPA: TIGR02594 family protein [Sphingomonas sp.]|jgi:uncharacterized protein (TIGR02594 family)